MRKESQKSDGEVRRRDFLKLAGFGCAATGVAAVVAKPEDGEAAMSPRSAGYRETEHVRAFYRAARF